MESPATRDNTDVEGGNFGGEFVQATGSGTHREGPEEGRRAVDNVVSLNSRSREE